MNTYRRVATRGRTRRDKTPGTGPGAAARGTAVPGSGPGAVLLLLALAACGGTTARVEPPPARAGSAPVERDAAPAAPATLPPAPGVGLAGTSATPVAAAPVAPAGVVGRAGTAPRSEAPDPRAVPSDLPSSAPMTVTLGATCVTPGGTQRVVVDTLPHAYLAYDNLYADRRDGSTHGGIDGRARSDARGHFEATWLVSPGAPLGDVRLDVAASAANRSNVQMLFYRVASSCP